MVVMARVLFLLALLQTTCCDPISHYRVFGAVYCPLKIQWTWSAKLWEVDDGGDDDDRLGCKERTGSAQFATYYMEGDVDDGNNEAEFLIVIRHTCHSDGKQRKFKMEDTSTDIAHGDSYLFKATHLGKNPGEIDDNDRMPCPI
ncbi:hypothetical protein B9Z55_008513 [Caenorhabditis nigoni]|uniref:Uncharacterized protein n=1 Tax=Caenorhabditis nigoni TaxID=1611254 RepID=A0A2G5UN41_9PELO|nr:hypothetical protein B9Z55_008513 [Caenorhabditis nigoni]